MKKFILALLILVAPIFARAVIVTDSFNGGYTSTATTITMIGGTLPDPASVGAYYIAVCRNYYAACNADLYYEIMKVTSKSGYNYVVTRGQNGTLASAKAAGNVWKCTGSVQGTLTPTNTVTATATPTMTGTITPNTPTPTKTPTATFTPLTYHQGVTMGDLQVNGTANVTGDTSITGITTLHDYRIGTASDQPNIVLVGESTMAGYGAAHGIDYYLTPTAFNGRAMAVTNLGTPGYHWRDIDANINVTGQFNQTSGMNIAVVWMGINDLTENSPAETFGKTRAHCEHYRQLGFKVIVATLHSVNTPITDSDRVLYNSYIRAQYPSFADGIADIGLDPNVGPLNANPGTGNTYFIDQYHCTTVGVADEGGIFNASINTLIAKYNTYQNCLTGSTPPTPIVGFPAFVGQQYIDTSNSKMWYGYTVATPTWKGVTLY